MWRPIEQSNELPSLGVRESQTLDLKRSATSDLFEIAKDVASFANAQGGSILYGAAGGDHLAKWTPLSEIEATQCEASVERAVRDRLRPAPLFGLERFLIAGGWVIALNVYPYPGQLVGVRLLPDELSCGDKPSRPDGVYWFPLRVGSHTRPVAPEQIAMFIDARVRRIATALEGIVGERIVLVAARYRAENASWLSAAVVKSVDALANQVEFGVDGDHGIEVISMPLDLVVSICKGPSWQVYISGVMKPITWLQDDTAPELRALTHYFDPLG
jgi:hypothetical protein